MNAMTAAISASTPTADRAMPLDTLIRGRSTAATVRTITAAVQPITPSVTTAPSPAARVGHGSEAARRPATRKHEPPGLRAGWRERIPSP